MKLAVLAAIASVAMGAEFRFGFQRDLMEANNSVTATVGAPISHREWYASADRLRAFHNSILALVPNKHTINYGNTEYGYIGDGGGDMYDTGHKMRTSLCRTPSWARLAPWQDNMALARMNRYSGTCLGTVGPRTARFNKEASSTMLVSVNTAGREFNFYHNGDTGADGHGTLQRQTYRRNGVVIFRRTVCNAKANSWRQPDPSINHFIVTIDTGRQAQTGSTNTNEDNHGITNIAPGAPWYSLVIAGGRTPQSNNCIALGVWNQVVNLMFEDAESFQWVPGGGNGAPLLPSLVEAPAFKYSRGNDVPTLALPGRTPAFPRGQVIQLEGLPAMGSAFTICAYAKIQSTSGSLFDFRTATGDALKLVVNGRNLTVYTRKQGTNRGEGFEQPNVLPASFASAVFGQYCVVRTERGNTTLYLNGAALGEASLAPPTGGARTLSTIGYGMAANFGAVYVNTNAALDAAGILDQNCDGRGTYTRGVGTAPGGCSCEAGSAGNRCQFEDAVLCLGHGTAIATPVPPPPTSWLTSAPTASPTPLPAQTGSCACDHSHYTHRIDLAGVAVDGMPSGFDFCDVCAPGYQGENCQHSNRFTCSNNGVAQPDGSCKCIAGFLGDACEHSDAVSCNGHGAAAADGTCSCSPGYAGDQCKCSETQYMKEWGGCADWSPECAAPDFTEVSAPSSTADRVCEAVCQPCTGDTYQTAACTTGQTQCAACTPCTDSQYTAQACTATSDRVCAAKTVLQDGLPTDSESATMTSSEGNLVLAPAANGAGVFVGETDELGEKLVDLQARLDESRRLNAESHRLIAELRA